MKKRLVVAAALLVALAVTGVMALERRVNTPYRGYGGDEQFITVPAGLGTRAIGRRLSDAGVVRDQITFRAALWASGRARRLQAGEYRFDRALSAREVVDKIVRGDVAVRPITFPEGLTIAEMARIFESSGLGTAAAFTGAARDASLVRGIDPAAGDLEGYLFPDTYRVARNVDAVGLVRLMVARFHEVLDARLHADAPRLGLSVRELVTLASMVEKETSRAEERPVVAAVYLNRLHIGMGMQCDPTLVYALQRAGRYDGDIRRADLMFDSRYNTYRYAGLPPGPIAAPGRASLEAAARPASVDYLYFVSRNDGSHEFARTLEEHNRNVQKFQVEYFRQQRAARSASARSATGR